VIRVDGQLLPLQDLKRLMQEDTIAMAFSIMNARQGIGDCFRGIRLSRAADRRDARAR
jgi:hypothetical protein